MSNPKIFFVVGAQKTGTTALFDYLTSYEEIDVPNRKELHELNKQHPISKAEYLKELGVDEGMTGDFSPSYLYSEYAAKNIFNYFPETKIIIVLRSPMSRAYSNMVHSVRIGQEKSINLNSLISGEKKRLEKNALGHYLSKGFYFDQVKRYLDLFGAENILIIKYEKFKIEPQQTLKAITGFLQIPFDERIKITKRNTGHVATNEIARFFVRSYGRLQRNGVYINRMLPNKILQKAKKILLKKKDAPSRSWFKEQNRLIFMEDISKLEKLTNTSFSEWYE
ncbi:MAG: hypothetical protein ACJATE_000763 [Bacteroidia bacterium]|jgi:hypothetical protein